jgi:hypothetical protein
MFRLSEVTSARLAFLTSDAAVALTRRCGTRLSNQRMVVTPRYRRPAANETPELFLSSCEGCSPPTGNG